MEGTERHRNLEQFNSRHFPERLAGHAPARGGQREVEPVARLGNLRVPHYSLRLYASTLGRDMVRDYGGLPYERFEGRFFDRIAQLHRLYSKVPREIAWVTVGMYDMLPAGRSFRRKLLDLGHNLRHSRAWSKRPIASLGGKFSFVPEFFSHDESPFALDVQLGRGRRHDADRRIASAGFRLLHSKDGVTLSINNIQGVDGRRRSLKSLNRFLAASEGMPARDSKSLWRVHIVKNLMAHADRHGFNVQGELPERSTLVGVENAEGEFRRLVRQYAQTFRKAGLTRVVLVDGRKVFKLPVAKGRPQRNA